LRSPSGVLDLLPDDVRTQADGFARDYHQLRVFEGWVGEHGREDPAGGDPALWRGRARGVAEAARLLTRRLGDAPLLLDVGSGGGWAAGMLTGAEVIAIDLLDAPAKHGLSVRGDMVQLPVRNGAADGVLYAASLHYAPVDVAVREAARVLRPGGLLIALDSPLYPNAGETEKSVARSQAYYAKVGHTSLAAHYHPIDAGVLRQALASAGFDLERLITRPRWRRRLRAGPASLVLASRLR
jgi:SAM-dependent methyltransferase